MAEDKPNSNEITIQYEVPPIEKDGGVYFVIGWRGKFNGEQYGNHCIFPFPEGIPGEDDIAPCVKLVRANAIKSKEAIEKLAEKSNETP